MSEEPNTGPVLPGPEEPNEDRSGLHETPASKTGRKWSDLWDGLLRLGLGETALRIGTGVVSVILILLVVGVMGNFYLKGQAGAAHASAALAATLPTPTSAVSQPEFDPSGNVPYAGGIPRLALLHTNHPDQPRNDITIYTIQKGDTIIGIANRFGLKPATVLLGNFDTLADDPERIYPGDKIKILPVDGALYTWHAGDGLNGVAKFYKVSVDDILNWPGNHLDKATIGDLSNPNIAAGVQILIPGGTRNFQSYSAPLISRKDPAAAKIFGPGFCGTQTEGLVGTGSFVYPTIMHWLSGTDYLPEINHWGIDLAGTMGSAIYAADSGVIVYAGWNDWGYGNVIVIDHGDGWQTLYAHLSEFKVGCGLSVHQGDVIALMGSTGHSTGPHLHFEIMSTTGYRVNPHSFLPPP